MGGGAHFLRRVPRIKFPQRHPKSSASVGNVPPPPKSPGVGGKASIQPERTPITAREIYAIILGGYI